MMPTATSHKTARAGRPERDPSDVSRLTFYQVIMTPINFVTFLVSLWLVDHHYQQQRTYESARRAHDSRLPAWLHRLVYKPQPYGWVAGGPADGGGGETRWYYHTKQKKMMRMQATEAFGLRNHVLVGLALAAVAAVLAGAWALCLTAAWASRYATESAGVGSFMRA